MIKLPNIKTSVEQEFLADIMPSYKKLLEDKKADTNFKPIYDYLSDDSGLSDNKIKKILIGNKTYLLAAIKNLDVLNNPVVVNEFSCLYKKFTRRKLGKELAEKIGVRVCPYCNRSYIFTLKWKGVRPQYDHFFPKSTYPYLAISLYNLIPSCSICNQAKADFKTYDEASEKEIFIYPYTDEYGYEVFFQTTYNGSVGYLVGNSVNFNLSINVSNASAELERKITNSIKELNLKELYDKHKDYVADIIKKCYIYNDSYADDLCKAYPTLFSSKDAVKNLVFMNYFNKEDWGNRILSKLAYDITKEFI